MNMKKIVMAAAILVMLPMQFVCAMSGVMPNDVQRTTVTLKKEKQNEVPDVSKDPFLAWYGWWSEKTSDRAMITVTRGEKGWYGFEISWQRNANQTDMWMMTAVPISKDTMQYKDCQHYLLTFNATNRNIIDKEETINLNGTGTITVNSANEMIWKDDQDRRAENCVFFKMDRPLGGGLEG